MNNYSYSEQVKFEIDSIQEDKKIYKKGFLIAGLSGLILFFLLSFLIIIESGVEYGIELFFSDTFNIFFFSLWGIWPTFYAIYYNSKWGKKHRIIHLEMIYNELKSKEQGMNASIKDDKQKKLNGKKDKNLYVFLFIAIFSIYLIFNGFGSERTERYLSYDDYIRSLENRQVESCESVQSKIDSYISSSRQVANRQCTNPRTSRELSLCADAQERLASSISEANSRYREPCNAAWAALGRANLTFDEESFLMDGKEVIAIEVLSSGSGVSIFFGFNGFAFSVFGIYKIITLKRTKNSIKL